MDSVIEIMNFILKMLDFILKLLDFYIKTAYIQIATFKGLMKESAMAAELALKAACSKSNGLH